jgi:hypothetical protein
MVVPFIFFELLEKLTSKQGIYISRSSKEMWPILVEGLNLQERSTLLKKCKHLPHSGVPELLVGRSLELYGELLTIEKYKDAQLSVFTGDPNDNVWGELAKLALRAGQPASHIAAAVQGRGYSWTGGMSSYYQQWIDRFEKLKLNSDPDLQTIADEGIKWSTEARGRELKREKHEAIFGFDSSLE